MVDVKARDQHARLHQIEIQLLTYRDLPARILYTWADLYSAQLQRGEDYAKLKPTSPFKVSFQSLSSLAVDT